MFGLATRAEFDAFLLQRLGRVEIIPFVGLPPDGPSVTAFINDNRWETRCECGGYAVVDPDDPGFFCHACVNTLNGHQPRPIWFPPPGIRRTIEAVLMASDDPLWRSVSFLAEDGADPGSALHNRVPSSSEVADRVQWAILANRAEGLPDQAPPGWPV